MEQIQNMVVINMGNFWIGYFMKIAHVDQIRMERDMVLFLYDICNILVKMTDWFNRSNKSWYNN